MKRRANFDPRPTAARDGPSSKQINDFLAALSYNEKPCYWQIHMSIVYDNFQFSDADLTVFEENVLSFYESLQELYSKCKPEPDFKGPFEFPDTAGQGKSDTWKILRALHCTASPSLKICKLTSEKSIRNFLRAHLWGLDPFFSKACRYGIKNEEKARQAYLIKKRKEDSSVKVITTGLHANTEYVAWHAAWMA